MSRSFVELTPQNFSFNSPLGWCSACLGLGVERGTNQAAIISNPNLTLLEGAVSAWPAPLQTPGFRSFLEALAHEFGIPLDRPWYQLEPAHQRVVLYGSGDRWIEWVCRGESVVCREEEEGAVDDLLAVKARKTKATKGRKATKSNKGNATGDSPLALSPQPSTLSPSPVRFQYKGLYPAIEEASRVSYEYRQKFVELIGEKPCSVCQGDRVRDDAAAVRLKSSSQTSQVSKTSEVSQTEVSEYLTLPQLCRRPLTEVLEFLKGITLSPDQKKIAGDLLNEATHRLAFLVDVGLDYLTLDRGMPTLSGGESQRIRLAGQIGRALTGVLYVLDEPTIGLHPRDNGRLIEALHKLRDLGNTVILVEHDREVLASADRLYDFGPGAGRHGGNITAQGNPDELQAQSETSLTGAYLSGAKSIPIPKTRRMERSQRAGDVSPPCLDDSQLPDKKRKSKSTLATPPSTSSNAELARGTHVPRSLSSEYSTPPGGAWLELLGAKQNNLRGVDLRLPLGTLVAVTGLSGSGKSSLIIETLGPAIARKLTRSGPMPGPHDELLGAEHLSRLIVVDQSPLGSTPASNPATYTGVWEQIRELFARLPDAKVRGFKAGRFSFNRAGGRCEDCEGMGQKKIEMHFLPDVWVECAVCRGKRFNQETLSVQYKTKSIADVLDLSIGQALEIFGNIPKIRAPLATLAAIGLDYLTLGQSAATLSGGEAQRVKLAAELCKPNAGKTLYLLDEPTTGLHFDDIAKLLKVLNSLVEQGNTVIVIEHNLDVIKTADWVVDMGPEAGVGGGWIVAQGTPEEIVSGAKRMRSWTAELLAPLLATGERVEIEIFDAAQAARKQAGDVDISKVGVDTAAPWQVDGSRWHTQDRISHQGKPCRWEGPALAHVVDSLAEFEDLAAPNWNHRSIVEVMTTEKEGGWFLHAQTGDEWLLTLKFRVKKSTFDEDTLLYKLALKSLDDLDELPVYGRGERVRAKNLKGPWQEVTVTVHWLREIETKQFAEFLKLAVKSYLTQARVEALVPAELSPWKVLGQKWHVSRKGFPSNKRVQWEPELVETLFHAIESAAPKLSPDWSNKAQVAYAKPGQAKPWCVLYTKRREGVDLELYGEPHFALGRVADLGSDRDISAARDGRQVIKLRFTNIEQAKERALGEFLKEHASTSGGR